MLEANHPVIEQHTSRVQPSLNGVHAHVYRRRPHTEVPKNLCNIDRLVIGNCWGGTKRSRTGLEHRQLLAERKLERCHQMRRAENPGCVLLVTFISVYFDE